MRPAAIAGLALLLLVAFLVWRPGAERADGPAPRARAPERLPGVTADAATEEPAAPGHAATVPWARLVEVQGTLVDLERHRLAGESGTLRLRVASGVFDVPVVDGAFRATVPPDPFLHFDEILLGDRKAVPLTPHQQMPEDGVVQVPCRWFVPTLLRVIGESGEDLRDVVVVESTYCLHVPDGHLATATSPLVLPHDDGGERTYWVRAPGYAWAHITVSLGNGGERVIRLSRAGALRVLMAGLDAEAGAGLEVNGLIVDADDDGQALIEGLPRGRFDLNIEILRDGYTVVFMHREVEIEPGRTTVIALTVTPVPELVRLAGTLQVDQRWPEIEFEPSIRAWEVNGAEVAAELAEDGRWFAGAVPPGRYVFLVDPWSWLDRVDVGASGARDVRLVVPPPCDVEVRLVEAATREPILLEDVLVWHVRSPRVDRELAELPWSHEEGCEQAGVWEFRAPIGTLDLELESRLVEVEKTEFELKPGRNVILLNATWTQHFDIALRDGAMPVPLDRELCGIVRVTPLDNGGALAGCHGGDPLRVWVTKPGRYRVSLPKIEGYEPIDPIDVEFPAGKTPWVEIPLQRRER